MPHLRAVGAVLLAALCFATTGTAQELADVAASPVAVGLARIALGGALLASTYVGGGFDDAGEAVVVAGNGDAIVAGWSSSSSYPVTPGAYQSSFAGIPPTETCMTCHSQIWADSPMLEPVRASFREDKSIAWNRVHDLPDFVYFNHSIHVKKGMGCETCHGRIDQMPGIQQKSSLQMEWCLDCHRNPEKYARPRAAVFTMGYEPDGDQLEIGRKLVQEYKIQSLTTCSTCHR